MKEKTNLFKTSKSRLKKAREARLNREVLGSNKKYNENLLNEHLNGGIRMDDINVALELAIDAMEKRYGDSKMEEGDMEVFQFNNCTLVILMEEGHFARTMFTNSEIFKIDHTVKAYEKAAEEIKDAES